MKTGEIMLFDYLLSLGLNIVKDKVMDEHERKKIEDKLRTYMECEWEDNEFCTRDEEMDLQGLDEYLQGKFLNDARGFLLTQDPDKRKEKEDGIINYAVACSKAEGIMAEKRAKAIVLNALTIIRNFYVEKADDEIRTIINDLVSILGKKIEKEADSIKDPLERMDTKLDLLLTREQFDLQEFILRQKEFVKCQTIFPWFNDGPKYSEVFPRLFIQPRIKKRNEIYTLEDLLQEEKHNYVLLGDYGVGKSTLLRYAFAFSNRDDCVYITAREAEIENEKGLLERIIGEARVSSRKLLIFIDGIDEAYHNKSRQLSDLVMKLKTASNCCFWLGCRTDFFKRAFNENIVFADENLEILPWLPKQTDNFIETYSVIQDNPNLIVETNRLIEAFKEPEKVKTNPFHLALVLFIAENPGDSEVKTTYDLYECFVRQWINREIQRGTCADHARKTIEYLRKVAGKIYDNEPFLLDETIDKNTAVKDLLVMKSVNIYNERYAVAFYHRSLAAFLLAQKTVEALLGRDISLIEDAFAYKLKDDVTNFIGERFSTLKDSEKQQIKMNLICLYDSVVNCEDKLSAKEQILYFISRLEVDVSDFLLRVIQEKPKDRIIRLTLAYGCVLSHIAEVREFALEYAGALAVDSTDTITNRAWTVVYFGDVDEDPYKYKDDEKASWKNARAARIKRFTKEKPRLKDYRFRLFDIPLFYSFLNDRGWKDISAEEYEILKTVEFPEEYFNRKEITFLTRQKERLLKEYTSHLQENE